MGGRPDCDRADDRLLLRPGRARRAAEPPVSWRGKPPGTLTVIGSAASAGKSTLVLDFCRSAAIRHKLPAVLFSLEMTAAEITTRLLSAESGISLHLLRIGQLTDDNRARLTERMAQIADAPFYISESPALSVDALSDEAARLAGGQGVRLVAVDCLQLITTDRRFEDREREVAEIAQQLKALALSLRVPVVIAAQLTRDPEQRAGQRPLLADLRDSDAIVQAADLVVLLHREHAFERESPRAGEADLIVAKHRNGPTGTVTVTFQGHYSRFADHQGLSATRPTPRHEAAGSTRRRSPPGNALGDPALSEGAAAQPEHDPLMVDRAVAPGVQAGFVRR
jgi:replicative DNA helicase